MTEEEIEDKEGQKRKARRNCCTIRNRLRDCRNKSRNLLQTKPKLSAQHAEELSPVPRLLTVSLDGVPHWHPLLLHLFFSTLARKSASVEGNAHIYPSKRDATATTTNQPNERTSTSYRSDLVSPWIREGTRGSQQDTLLYEEAVGGSSNRQTHDCPQRAQGRERRHNATAVCNVVFRTTNHNAPPAAGATLEHSAAPSAPKFV